MGGPFSAVGKLVAIPVDGVVLMGGGVANDATGESSGDLAYVEALSTMAAIACGITRRPDAIGEKPSPIW